MVLLEVHVMTYLNKSMIFSALAVLQLGMPVSVEGIAGHALNRVDLALNACTPSLTTAAIGAASLIAGGLATNKCGPKAGVCIGAAAAIVGLAVSNYAKIRALDKKRDPDHVFLGDKRKAFTKFYKWEKRWPTARIIDENWRGVIERFITLHKINRLRIADAAGNIIPNPTWTDIYNAIGREKDEFWADIQTLENDHLLYFSFFAEGLFDASGIKKDYKNACAAAPKNDRRDNANPSAPESWTVAQERFINEYMENPWAQRNIFIRYPYRLAFTVLKPNYGYAAQTHWKIFKQWQRLVALERIVEHVLAYFSNHLIGGGPGAPVIINQIAHMHR